MTISTNPFLGIDLEQPFTRAAQQSLSSTDTSTLLTNIIYGTPAGDKVTFNVELYNFKPAILTDEGAETVRAAFEVATNRKVTEEITEYVQSLHSEINHLYELLGEKPKFTRAPKWHG